MKEVLNISEVEISDEVIQKWQAIVDTIAEIINVPASLIMKIESPYIKVFSSSNTKGNPYKVEFKEYMEGGLYCEEVAKTLQKLLVPNALIDKDWENNPDIKLGMISYLGFPLLWPNGDIFGTLCVLDRKANSYSKVYEQLMRQFKELIEAHLDLLYQRKSLQMLSERLTLATKSAKVGVWDWNVKDNLLIWDDSMYELYGVRKENFSGAYEAWKQGVHPDDLERADEEVQRALRGEEKFDTEFRILWPSGIIRVIKGTASVYHDKEGKPLRMIGVNRDITERKEAEKTKELLTQMIMHDLNNPLAALSINLNILEMQLQDHISDDLKNILRLSLGLSAEIKNMTSNLLDINKMEEGKLNLRYEEMNLESLINEVIRSVDPLAKELGKNISLELSLGLSRITADHELLRRTILNLVTNALKFGKSNVKIEATVSEDAKEIIVSVSDDGMGIAKEYLVRVLDKFVQVEDAQIKGKLGKGLGLTFCKMAVEAHAGRIWVESEVGEGSTFSFTLPIEKKNNQIFRQESSLGGRKDVSQ